MILLFKNIKLFPRPIMIQVLKAYCWALIVNRFKNVRASGIFSVGQYRIRYPHYGSMYIMFKEVFLDQNYYLQPTNEPLSIIDCGSSVGDSIIYFKIMCPNSNVMAFEPNPVTFDFLKQNVLQNNLKDVSLHNLALSSENGHATFYTDSNLTASQGASLTKHLESKKRLLKEMTVETAKLSDFLPEKVDVLKLDIEGAEGLVIDDLATSNRLGDFRIIFLEYHYDGVNTNYPLSRILQRLEQAGFEYSIASPFSLPFIKSKKIFSYKITAYKQGVFS